MLLAQYVLPRDAQRQFVTYKFGWQKDKCISMRSGEGVLALQLDAEDDICHLDFLMGPGGRGEEAFGLNPVFPTPFTISTTL